MVTDFIRFNLFGFSMVICTRLLATLFLSSSYLYSETDLLNISKFKEEWEIFLHTKQIDYNEIALECFEAEFDLLEEFNDQLIIRCRSFESIIDRYEDCRPYTQNRIILSDGTEMSASSIQLPESSSNFIATQAPFQHNIPIFWQMIAENKIQQIVMLTELVEVENPEKELACLYWLDKVNETLTVDNGIEITLLEKSELFSGLQESIEIRKFNVRSQGQDQLVVHYWYRNWLDNKVPRQIETVLALTRSVIKDKENLQLTSPIVVHCAAGVGRTGVFITLYYLMQEKFNDPKRNLFHFVAFLRWQRPWMVATLSQYEFLKKVLKILPIS